MLLTVLLAGLTLAHAGWLTYQHVLQQARQTALLVADLVTDAAETYRSPEALREFVSRLTHDSLTHDIVVATVDPLQVIVSSIPPDDGRPLDSIAHTDLARHMRAVALGEVGAGLDSGLARGWLFAQPIRLRVPALGLEDPVVAIIGIHLDPAPLHELERKFITVFAIWTLAGIGTGLLLFVWILRRRLLQPLAAIRDTVQQRRAGVREARIPPLRQDELGQLAADINTAIDFIEAREERIRRLAMIAQGTDNGVIIAAPDGVIEWTNGAFTRITGYTAEEAHGRRPRDFLRIPGTDYAHVDQLWERIRAGRRVAGEVQVLSKDARRVVAEIEGYPIRSDRGDVTGCVFIAHDVTESRATRQEIVSIVARFQQELAYDLHDHIGGDLGGLSFRARTLADRLRQANRPEAQAAEELHAALGTVADRARNLSRTLAPTSPEQGGLVSALARLCRSTSAYSDAEVVLRHSGTLPDLEPWRANHVYLIAQEALRNAIRHGRASRIHVALAGHADHMTLCITSQQGPWDPGAPGEGLGMRIIRYRARTLNAGFTLRVHRSGVTRVRLEIPVKGQAGAQADLPG